MTIQSIQSWNKRLLTKWLALFLLLGLIIFMVLPVLYRVRPLDKGFPILHKAKTLGLACKLWANDHEGKFPTDLKQLVPNYLPDDKPLHYFSMEDNSPLEFIYFGAGRKDTDPGSEILLTTDPRWSKEKRIVVRIDQSGMMERIKH